MVQALTPGKVSDLNPKTDAEIIAWFRKVRRYDSYTISREQAAQRREGPAAPGHRQGRPHHAANAHAVAARRARPGVKALDMPKAGRRRSAPLRGHRHSAHARLPRAGDRLAEARRGAARRALRRRPHDVRAHHRAGHQPGGALQAGPRELDGLGDHARQGQGGGRAPKCACPAATARPWPAAPPMRTASSCSNGVSPQPPYVQRPERIRARGAWFVSARAKDDKGVEDLAFTWSDWQRGIEPWRFNVPTNLAGRASTASPTPIFDRTLLRAGETVSMKQPDPHADQQGLRPAGEPARHPGHHPHRQRPALHAAAGLAQDRHRRPERGEHLRHSAGRQARRVPGRCCAPAKARMPAAKASPTATRTTPAASAPACSASRNSACRCSRAASRPPRRSRWWPPPACPPTCRSTTWPAAAPPTCRCACRPWCAARASSFSDYDAFSFNPPRATQGDGTEAATPAADTSAGEEDLNGVERHPRDRRQAAAHARTRTAPARSRSTRCRMVKARRASCCSRPPTPTRTARCRRIRSTQTLWPAVGHRRHQDRGLGLHRPEAEVPGARARPHGQARRPT